MVKKKKESQIYKSLTETQSICLTNSQILYIPSPLLKLTIDLKAISMRFCLLCVVCIMGFSVSLSPVSAARPLMVEDLLQELIRGDVFRFESLPKGPVQPSGPSGCTNGSARNGGPCPLD